MDPVPTAANAERTAAPVKCGTCEALTQVPFACEDCHQLLAHVQGANYFELFGLPRSYEVDVALLEERYLAISRNIHPDKYATAGEEMQAFALRASASVNSAYDVLRDPLHRAEYLLESAGGKSATQDKRVPQDLLAQVLTLREELEEAKASNNRPMLEDLRERVVRRKQATEQDIVALCCELSAVSDQAKNELRLQLNAMKYLNNLLAQM
ncbi:MAG TPA: Fe-S protein assembly co-chaperone HscB [Phycisphaerae bacterium]|nr:Fe-S protein assembly co-chaperone HscB [Phycisphaerae bacterium]